ncbi:MAG: gluconate:H+ symporter [Bacteroidota bacterium]
MLLLVILLGVLSLLLLIGVLRINAFLAFILVSLGIGLGVGLPLDVAIQSVQKGMGDTLGFIVLILGLGAMLGKMVAESGAAQQITQSLTQLFGQKNIQWALVLTGFIVGIPLFYSVGFVILVPLIFSITQSTRLPMVYLGLPMLSALSVTHGYLPPHPAPTAIAADFGADIGLTLLYGIVIAIPAIIVAGPIFARTLGHIKANPPKELFNMEQRKPEDLPGLGISLLTALMPVVLIGVSALLQMVLTEGTWIYKLVSYLGNPVFALLLSVLVAVGTLGIGRGQKMKAVMDDLVEAIKGVTMVMLIIGGAGAFKQIMKDGGVSDYLAQLLIDSPLPPLVLAWGMAALIRVCVGSATVAGLTTAGILLPFVQQISVSPELMVLAAGAGSLMFSHVNDGGFWMFKEYFGLSLKDTFRSWSVMETIVSVMGLLGVLVLNIWI